MKINYRVGTFLGAPIVANISIALVFLYFFASKNFIVGLISSVSFLILLLVHEMGHAWYVKKYNHDLVEIKLYPIHGHCLYEYDSRFLPETLIFAGGLIAQSILLLVTISVGLILEALTLDNVLNFLTPVFDVFIRINIFILILNSLPIPGLDGFELWKRLWGKIKEKLQTTRNKSSKKANLLEENANNVVDLAIQRAKKKK